MKKLLSSVGIIGCVLALSAPPAVSFAHQTGYRHTHNRHSYQYKRYSGCEARRHRKARNGTVIGGLGGAFLGSQLAGRGARTEGTLIGAGIGAVAGHHVAQRRARCR